LKLDRKLNLVIPVTQDNNVTVYVHAAPISREVFERYFLVISKTHAQILGAGLGWSIAPRVASMMLEKVAKEDDSWEGPAGVARGLIGDIVRLANVAVPDEKGGWTTIPLQQALDQSYFSEDDTAEIKNAVVFFTVASWMYPRADRNAILSEAMKLWGGRTESSNSTEFVSSLPISTETANSGATETASSIPH